MPIKLALFDLDNTLLATDSDYQWGQFLCDNNLVDRSTYEAANRDFYAQYEAGTLDIDEFLRFSLKPLTQHAIATLQTWHQQFMRDYVLPNIPAASRDLVAKHRALGHITVIVTATNDFVTGPIAQELGVDHLIAAVAVKNDDGYTGAGIPCFQAGKIDRLQAWLDAEQHIVEESWFYSDSRNDIPMLEWVDHPTAVDADPTLTAHAQANNWPLISLRQAN